LNITSQCTSRECNITNLKIFAKKNILLNNDLALHGVFNIFNRSHRQNDVLFQNVKGFNENKRAFATMDQSFNEIRSIQITNVNFDFYSQGKLIPSENCTSENFNSKTNFFGSLKFLLLIEKVFYTNKICSYVFTNTNLEHLYLSDISNSLIFVNRLEFLVIINETKGENMLKFLVLSMYCETLSVTNLNPFAFKHLEYLLIQRNLEHFEEVLFENFKEIKFISIKSDEIVNFFHRGTKWLNSINKKLNVNLSKIDELSQNISKLVSVEFNVLGFLVFNKYYTFPNEDICLFKDFPHSQLVLPLIIFDASRFEYTDCTCSLVWLQQYYKLYFYNNFSQFNEYINIEPL
jgi:hypothetical protein